MTADRKRRLRRKLQASRERLIGAQPFIGLLLMYLKFVAAPGMRKISTNGRCIYFSADFLDKLYDRELDYLLCHQILHIAYGHIWPPSDRKGKQYHLACDILTNSLLEAAGLTRDRYPHLGRVQSTIPNHSNSPAEMTVEEIYTALSKCFLALEEQAGDKLLADEDTWWDEEGDRGESGEIILDLPEIEGKPQGQDTAQDVEGDGEGENGENGEEGEALRAQWKERASLAALAQDAGEDADGAGGAAALVKRLLAGAHESTLDWRRILDHFLQESVCDYSFSPPDRRFTDTGFFLPDFNERDFVTKEILFMADTSGSVRNEDLAAVYSEIRGAIEQFDGKLIGKLGFFDTEVTPPIPFETVGDLFRILPYGGGGTDFRVIFDYLQRNCKDALPACIVIFTDGYGPFPAKQDTMHIPVLWIINNSRSTPPFGKIARTAAAQAALHD